MDRRGARWRRGRLYFDRCQVAKKRLRLRAELITVGPCSSHHLAAYGRDRAVQLGLPAIELSREVSSHVRT
jgi:hypothetical protein